MILTSIVNLPVSNSVRNGSDIGSMLSRSSSRRIKTCCSNSATARGTSSLRANTNFRAVDVEIVFPSIFLFTISINSLTAQIVFLCRRNEKQKMKLVLSEIVFNVLFHLRITIENEGRNYQRLIFSIQVCQWICAFDEENALSGTVLTIFFYQQEQFDHTSNAHKNKTPITPNFLLLLSVIFK